jgi:trk system potassium uptake protein TrkH
MIASLFFTFGIIFGAFSIISLFPLLIALSFGEADQVEVFFLQFALLGFLSGSLIFAFTGKVKQEDRMTEFRILVLAWLITPIFLSLPLYWQLNVTWFNALFETVSGLTTTGATIFNSLDTLPKSIIFWRAFLQWAGGFATLVGIVLVLAPKGAGGLPLLRLGGQLTQIGMKKTLRLFSAYAAITSACLVALALTGIPFFDAVSLALTSVSTGGFMPRDGTISDYNNALAEIVLIAAMVAGATSIVWHRMIIQKRVQQLEEHKESYALIALVLIMDL